MTPNRTHPSATASSLSFPPPSTRRRYQSTVFTTTELKPSTGHPGLESFPNYSCHGKCISFRSTCSTCTSADAIRMYPVVIFPLTLRLPRGSRYPDPSSLLWLGWSYSTAFPSQSCVQSVFICTNGPTTFRIPRSRRYLISAEMLRSEDEWRHLFLKQFGRVQ